MRASNGHGGVQVAPSVASVVGERPIRRVLFVGKSMSRSRCTAGLVDALQRHGLKVKWVNMATLRRWLGRPRSLHRAARVFRAFAPDLMFVFCRDLPLALLREFKQNTRIVLWVEELLDDLEHSLIDYMKHADLVCMSNPTHRERLQREGVSRVAFLMSGFSPRYHAPMPVARPVRDVVFIGGPGRHGQRAGFLAELSEHFETDIFGVPLDWEPWIRRYPHLRVHKPVDNRGYRKLCATSRVVLGLNQLNSDPLYFSNRTFLTLACRGFHLTRYVPGLETVFDDGGHLAWYSDTDECVAKIEHYLDNPDDRLRIAHAGHELVLAEHQYYHRIGRILEIMGTPSVDAMSPPLRVAALLERQG